MQTDLSYWTATPVLRVFTATVSLDKAITGKGTEIPEVAGNNKLETAEGNEWALGGAPSH